jgi:hypothetical protein
MTETVKFEDGSFCMYKKMVSCKVPYNAKYYCPLCNNIIKEGETIYLVFNNYVMFPNCIIHEKCCEKVINYISQSINLSNP